MNCICEPYQEGKNERGRSKNHTDLGFTIAR